MNKYSKDFKNYLNDLAAKAPAPGGGSAVALSLCLGMSLLEKAINYSAGKHKELNKYASRLIFLRKSMLTLVDIDADIFEKYMHSKGKMRIYFLKKSDEIIIKIGKTCGMVFNGAKSIESDIKESIISDFHIGLDFILLALKGCIVNLTANSKTLGKNNIYIGKFKHYLEKWQKF